MSNKNELDLGKILWQDLTVPNTVEVRDFYQQLICWDCIPEEMGGYDDYHMIVPSTGDSIAGICHAQGENADIPAVWMIYITVEDADKSAQKCRGLGGEVVVEPRIMGSWRFCVICDPAGAMCALYKPPEGS